MPRCRTNRQRRARARKRQAHWNRKNAFRKLAKLGGEFIRDMMERPSFMSQVLPTRSPLRVELDDLEETHA